MPLNPNILGHVFRPVEQRITPRDAAFYALSVGIGQEPLDPAALAHVYEPEMRVFPTMATVLGHPGPWWTELDGVTRHMIVHGATRLQLLRPLPAQGMIVGANQVVDLVDKGDRGAIIVAERVLSDAVSGEVLARLESSSFCRADGGFGGKAELARDYSPVPATAPDRVVQAVTRPESALLFRLNGDLNPLHADPAAARKAGFDRPILHGLCSYGAAAWALCATVGGGRNLVGFEARFSRPVFPGEALQVEIWTIARDEVAFRVRIPERGVVVLDCGRARFAELDR
jgi:acyl dehydratase